MDHRTRLVPIATTIDSPALDLANARKSSQVHSSFRRTVNSGPSLPKARHKPERRGGGKTGMIDVNGKNNKVEQKNNKKTKTMGDVTLKGYDMTNTVTKGTGVRVHKQ